MNEQPNLLNPQEPVLLELNTKVDLNDWRRWSFYYNLHSAFYWTLVFATGILGALYVFLSIHTTTIKTTTLLLGICFLLYPFFLTLRLYMKPRQLLNKRKQNGTYAESINYIFRENNLSASTQAEQIAELSSYLYTVFGRVIETDHAFYMVLKSSPPKVYIIPKPQLSQEQIQWLSGFLSHKFGSKFKSK